MTALTPTGYGSHNSAAYVNYTSSSAVRADAAYRQTSDIVFHTLEGDKVTLSSSTFSSGGYETYESLAMGNGAFAYRYSEASYFKYNHQMNISVTGDLNEEELEDINQILSTLDDMMKDLMAGNLEGALSRSSEFSGVDAIASFSANLSMAATYTSNRFETATASTTVPVEDQNAAAGRQIDQTADKISDALKSRTTLLKHLLPKINDTFSEWMDSASDNANSKTKGSKWAKRFAGRLMDGIKQGTPHEIRGKDQPIPNQIKT